MDIMVLNNYTEFLNVINFENFKYKETLEFSYKILDTVLDNS